METEDDKLYFPANLSPTEQWKTITPFSKNTFTDADIASRYLTSDKFREFWSRGKVPVDSEMSFSYRVQTGDNNWLGGQNPSVRRNYQQLFSTQPEPVTFSDLLIPDNSLARQNAARVEGRFFTPLVDVKEANNLYDSQFSNVTRRGYPTQINPSQTISARAQDPLGFYLNSSQNAEMLNRGRSGFNRPISMLIDENQFRYRMPEGPWGVKKGMTEEEFLMRGGPGDTIASTKRNRGWDAASFESVNSGENAQELARKYGVKLGNAVSSNPEQEIFVPKTLANKARRVGNVVNIIDKNPKYGDVSPIEIWGPPKVSPKTQVINNVKNIAGNALGAASMAGDAYRLTTGGGIGIGPDGLPMIMSKSEFRESQGIPWELQNAYREETPAEIAERQKQYDKENEDIRKHEELGRVLLDKIRTRKAKDAELAGNIMLSKIQGHQNWGKILGTSQE